MRAIKFRGKSSNGEWHYGDLEHSPIGKFCRIHEYWDNGLYKSQYDVDPATIGQFTGLTDKNGKEIYEGDIVRHDENSECFVVVYDAPEFCYKDNSFGFRYMVYTSELITVVGNIHDNPELMKGGEQ